MKIGDVVRTTLANPRFIGKYGRIMGEKYNDNRLMFVVRFNGLQGEYWIYSDCLEVVENYKSYQVLV